MQRKCLLLVLMILALVCSAAAETRYVTDQVLVSLRPAQDDRSAPLERLATGMKVEVLEDLGAFLKIKSSAGNIGFARAQYFITTPPKRGNGDTAALREELAAAQKKGAELAAELQKLKSAPAAGGNGALQTELEKTRAELADVTKRYQLLQQNTDDLEGIIRERDQLKKDAARLTEENGKLRTQPSAQGGSALQWFFAGGAVFLVGWLVGKASRQKRRF